MPFYKAGRDVHDRVQVLIDGYYHDLQEARVTYTVFLVHPSQSAIEKPPLKVNGQPVDGITKINSYEARMNGAADFQLKLSAPRWADMGTAEQDSLLDRLLYRLEVQREKAKAQNPGAIMTDDCGRPKLKLRPFDHQVQVFDAIIRRHGPQSVDARALEELSLHFHTLMPPGQ